MELNLILFGFVSAIVLCSNAALDLWSYENSTEQVNYVFPNSSVTYYMQTQHPCLTINDYASKVDTFFLNDSIFLFIPGNHRLDLGLNITGIHNLSFVGLSDKDITIIMVLNESTYILWVNCKNITIASIMFSVESAFNYILSFVSTQFIKLANITIHGDEQNYGCSSIIVSEGSSVYVSESNFDGNRGSCGAAIMASESDITFTENNYFVNNTALSGGALYLNSSTVLFSGTNSFTYNTADYVSSRSYMLCKCRTFSRSGGAIIVKQSMFTIDNRSMLFQNNFAGNFGGAMDLTNTNLVIYGGIIFRNNSARLYGGAIECRNSRVQICESSLFEENHAYIGGAIDTYTSHILFSVNCSSSVWSTSTVFHLNKAQYSGGSVNSHDSYFYFMGNVQFNSNTAGYGGAITLDRTSSLILNPNLNLSFLQNYANETGGVIYYDYSVPSDLYTQNHDDRCFFSFDTSLEGISLSFINNSASKAGSLLYSGKIDKSDICHRHFDRSSILGDCFYSESTKSRDNYCRDLYMAFFNVSNATLTESRKLFSADTENIQVCLYHYQSTSESCNNYKHIRFSVYPGENFNVSLIAMGTFNFPVSTRIFHKMLILTDENIELRRIPPTKVTSSCTDISYFLLVPEKAHQPTAQFKLYHQNPCDSLVDGVNLYIDIKHCPVGFQLTGEHNYKKCNCDKWLQEFGITECNINNLSIKWKKNTFWVSKQTNDSGLILHNDRCPLDFCKAQLVNVSLDNPSVQCDFNRTGTLCGHCREQYSLALGTLHCLYCVKSSNIALVIPFALAGVALVIVIPLLHLTVDVGTLNGLIFYANIVHSNREAYFQHTREINNFHSLFISWLNLDFGIETCFYDGMSIYTYSWLQFLFPFYLWFLISAIIFICHYSQRASRSLGRNPVAALGTVLFLSYGKILNAVIVPLSKTELAFTSTDGSNYTHSVWLYDGSVDYFTEPKHIALGLFAILILLLAFVPYTFILLCSHWLIAYSDKCFLSWLNKIKPFMDVYYAPFKQEARHLIGLTLIARLALLPTIAINAVGSDSVNTIVIASVTVGLLSIKGRVYTHRYNDILESSFILNLCILSIATFYLKKRNIQNKLAILSTSIGITFVTFIGIVIFHIYLLLKSTRIWNICVISMFCKSKWLCKVFGIVQKEDESLVLKSNDPEVVTSTLVELREPLIDNDEV